MTEIIIGDEIIVPYRKDGGPIYINLPPNPEAEKFDWSKVKIEYRCIDGAGIIRDEFGNEVPYVASLPDDPRGQSLKAIAEKGRLEFLE